jgi:hypothetical protein
MNRARKRRDISNSTRVKKTRGKKAKVNTNKSSSRKYSAIKGSGKSTKKRTIQAKPRVIKQKTRKTGTRRLTVRASTARGSKIGRSQRANRASTIRNSPKKRSSARAAAKKKIIRVLDHGQFFVDSDTLRKLNTIDNSIVRRLESGNLDDREFKTKVEQLAELVTKKGKPLDPKMIVGSDIILPDSDLSIEEASKIFYGEGIIPGLD